MPTLSPATWQPCASQSHKVRAGYAKFALAWLLCFVLLAARSWLILQGFHLFAEDGAIFFASAWNDDLFKALTTSYAGYYHLLPRLIAEAATLLPYAYTPWTYAAVALALTAGAISWLQLPHYRWLIRNDWLRFAIVILIALSPNWESITTISYLQWALAWWAALVVLMPLDNRWLRVGVAVVYVLAIWTAPVLLLLLPIWLLRVWRTRAKGDAVMVAVFALAHFVYIAATLQAPRDVAAPVDWSASIADLLRAYSYRVTGANFLGVSLTESIHVQYGWPLLHGFAIIATALLLAVLIALHPPRRTLAVAVFLYIGISSLSFYLLRSTGFRLPFLVDEAPLAFTHRRYFLLASASLLVLVGMVLDGLPVRYGQATARRISLVTVALFVLVFAQAFVEPALDGPSWSQYGEFLDRWRNPNADSGDLPVTAVNGEPRQGDATPWQAEPQRIFLPIVARERTLAHVSIPITPQGWSSILLAPAHRPQFTSAGQDLLFVDSQAHTVEDAAQLNLTWQYAGAAAGATPGYWQPSLWLFEADQGPVACQPLSVVLPDPWLQPGQIFFSQATMPLPSAPAEALWRLVISSAGCPATLPIVVPPP